MYFFKKTPEKQPAQPQQQQNQQQQNQIVIVNRETSEYFRKPGQTTGGYKRLEKLGGGSFGSVYKAEDHATGTLYAVKLLNYHTYESNLAAKKYIQTEFDILNKLKNGQQHPHIVNIPDVLDQYTYVFEYCNGDSLQKYFMEKSPITENTLKTIFVQILSALQFLHSQEKPIVHRDLKPANVLVHQNNNRFVFKLTDFGFSKSMTEIEMLGSNVGSPLFTAPEIGKIKYDHMVDIFSLGVVFFYIARARYNDPVSLPVNPEQIYRLPSTLSADFKDLLIRMINPNPKQRITIQEIIRSKWLQDKFVQLEVPGQDRYLMNLQDLYQIQGFIESKFNLSLADQLVLVSYHDSDKLYLLEDTIERPIYTVDRVYLISKKHEIPRILFSPLDKVSKFSEIIKQPMVWTIHKLQDEKLADARRVQFIVTDILKKSLDYLRLYALFKEFYVAQIKTPNFTLAMNRIGDFCKNNQANHQALENVRNLKDLDNDGNETNESFVDRLPFIIKTFLQRDIGDLYDNIIKISKDLDSKEKSHTHFNQNVLEGLLEVEGLSKQFETVRAGLNQLRGLNESSFGFIFDTETLMKHFSAYVENCYKLYIKYYSAINKDLSMFIDHFNSLIKSLSSLDTIQNQSQNIIGDQELINEIAKIPTYYKRYQSELRRRSEFQALYDQQTRRFALDIHTLIQGEISLRSNFRNVDLPKYFIPLALSNRDIENPLHNFLPTAESLSLRDFITSEGFDMIDDDLGGNQNLVQTKVMLDLIKENGELQRELSELRKQDHNSLGRNNYYHQDDQQTIERDDDQQNNCNSVIYNGDQQQLIDTVIHAQKCEEDNNNNNNDSLVEEKEREIAMLREQFEELSTNKDKRIQELERSLNEQKQRDASLTLKQFEFNNHIKSLQEKVKQMEQQNAQYQSTRDSNSQLLERIRELEQQQDSKNLANQFQTSNLLELKDNKISELEKEVINLREAARILELSLHQ
ncbi:hypothetical protein PPL_03276 [Heterostelium album PN500]|uniref:non-specific serine/threonine protein kinase n=1 Tax=Heterostelium pallidum (strain ATCC 26659 / Pp 5 / PN500) TaxID=670386 RepID=D3B4F2_HETP5|nr:hypothetical protein PPL_03276 [Heterostelium album PN500]EFA84200.1 hypothetical protein PPL_03276 [Heterostelium album PN500]|eukprot:XP_020436316.1 hypothetical protein PPL_03276 [Heterostelium album PN500]